MKTVHIESYFEKPWEVFGIPYNNDVWVNAHPRTYQEMIALIDDLHARRLRFIVVTDDTGWMVYHARIEEG